MISRKQIISRSCSEALEENINNFYDEEDVWYFKDKLIKDHIQEILNKWEQIDDEIWAKIICMELNRRVAKAYARAPVVTINGSTIGFDGYRVGLRGFNNPKREEATKIAHDSIGDGIKMKMDECGNILIKRLSKSEVYVKPLNNKKYCNSLGSDLEECKGKLEVEKASVLFDMKKFHSNIAHELKGAYPDRKNLESQCITCIAFGKCNDEILDIPSWIMVINVVALELVKCKIPPIRQKIPKFVSIFCAQKLTSESSKSSENSDETDASITNDIKKETQTNPETNKHESSTVPDSGNKNLREKIFKLSKQDFEKIEKISKQKSENSKYQKEDPYYCGLSAKVSKFEKRKPKIEMSAKENRSTEANGKSNLQIVSGGYLNSAMRKLPIHCRITPDVYSGNSGSEGAYYHIYSSIPEINKISRHSADEITIPASEKYRRIKRHMKHWR